MNRPARPAAPTRSADALVTVAGRRRRCTIVTLKAAGEEPRLRFDKVVIELVSRLQSALGPAVPPGWTLLVTVTAPVRESGKTAVAIVERARRLLQRRAGEPQLTASLHGNRVRMAFLAGGTPATTPVLVFVHNPEPSPRALLEVTRALLSAVGAVPRGRRGSRPWLVVDDPGGRAPIATLRQVYRQLCRRPVFAELLVRDAQARLASLGE